MTLSNGLRSVIAAVILAGAALWSVATGYPAASQNVEAPKPTKLEERVEKRLVQLDVAVEGDREAIRAITAKDVALYVGEREVRGLIVDPLCGELPKATESPGEQEASTEPSARARATFLFFFDQPHLTILGRTGALETSRALIARLIVQGAKASIVSSGKRLETIVPLTDNRERLLDGLERLRHDPQQLDEYAAGESTREDQVRAAYQRSQPLRRRLPPSECEQRRCPPWLALTYAAEELRIARTSTARLAIVVGDLAEAPVPKALVYFGDTLRIRSGLHYLQLIKCQPCRRGREICGACQDPFDEVGRAESIPSAASAFDAVVSSAVARGVHFFTIQAEGLLPGPTAAGRKHAQEALGGLAAETGGQAFFGGASTEYIGKRIDTLTSCRLLLSFPPADLPVDTAMNVTVALIVPKVKIRSQGRIVVPGPGSIRQSRLLAAFVNPDASDDGSLRALLIPRGGDGKSWKASIQLRLRPSGLPDKRAEVGASIVRHDTVIDHFAASIATPSGARPLVLEKTLDIAPGKFSVVAVAFEPKEGDIGSNRLDADWPTPGKSAAAIAPIAVLQAGPAAMTKDGVVSSSGSLARDVDERLDPSADIVLQTVVCRGAKTKTPIVVERMLEDGLPNEFAPMTIEANGDPCVQIVDVATAGRLQQPAVDYRVVAKIGDEIVAQESRTLQVGAATNRP